MNRPICLADKPLLSYTEATINEVMRHTCLVYTVPHSATADLVSIVNKQLKMQTMLETLWFF